MGENSKIEWTATQMPDGSRIPGHTFNPWLGCSRVSQGCVNCYAEEMLTNRYKVVEWGPGNARKRTSAANWKQPVKWNKQAQAQNTRYKVFCASLADIFDAEAPQEWRDDLWRLIHDTPHLDWLLLTKRPQNIAKMVPAFWLELEWPANVWLGVTVENQEAANERIPLLLQYPAPVRFLSCEPLLGPVDIRDWIKVRKRWLHQGGDPRIFGRYENHMQSLVAADWVCPIDWVIVGGESGNAARPMHPEWALDLRDQCAASIPSIPFFFKQWGSHCPATQDDLNKTHAKFVLIDRTGRLKALEEAFDPVCGDEMLLRTHKKDTGRLLANAEYSGFPTPKFRLGNGFVGNVPIVGDLQTTQTTDTPGAKP